MTMTGTASSPLKYSPEAYRFVDQALRHTQRNLRRVPETPDEDFNEEEAHISGVELLDGIRDLALREFGLMTIPVFRQWGVRKTDDFGRIVFDFIEKGAMRKTDRDQLSDFVGVYEFDEVFDRDYEIDLSRAFSD
jgi:uncharacterized repeat protein (TIGR04138 family)